MIFMTKAFIFLIIIGIAPGGPTKGVIDGNIWPNIKIFSNSLMITAYIYICIIADYIKTVKNKRKGIV